MIPGVPTVSFISIWNSFKSSHSEELTIELSKTVNDILTHYSGDVDYSSLNSSLSEILADKALSGMILLQATALVNKLVEDKERRQKLLPIILPSLSYQILHRYRQQPTDSIIKHYLDCVKNISRDVTVTYLSQFTTQLIHLLIKLILRGQGDVVDVSLAVLANLSRNNLLVQGVVKSSESIRSLYSRLMVLLSDDDRRVIVHSLSLFTALTLNEDLGNKFFVGNVTETYTLVMNNMLTSDDVDIQLYSLNLLIDFTKSPTMLAAFTQNEGTLLTDLLDLIEDESVLKDKVCELLHSLASKESELYSKIIALFSDDVTNCLVESLNSSSRSNNISVLGLLHVLSPDVFESGECKEQLVRQLFAIIENIPLHSPGCHSAYLEVAMSCRCLRSQGCDDVIVTSLAQLPPFIQTWLDSAPASGEEICVESVRACLELVELCTDRRVGALDHMLTHPNLPLFIGKGILSDDGSLITLALKINSLCCSLSDSFCNTVGSIISHHWHDASISGSNTRQELSELKQKYTDLQQKTSLMETIPPIDTTLAPSSQITELIAQMRDGLQVSDVKSSQLIEIFQEKLAIMTTKEQHLHDLVDAKTMALQQSDRLFTQFKNRVAQAEKECDKYRTMLKESEIESEQREDEMRKILTERNELLAEVENLRNECMESSGFKEKYWTVVEEVSIFKEKLNTAATLTSDLSGQIEGLKEEVDVLRVHNETLKSQHESDVTQVQVLQKEKEKVVSKLEEKDTLYLKTKTSLRQSEEKNRKKEKEKIEIESVLAKTRNVLSKTESSFKELTEKEASLRRKLEEKDKLIASQIDKITSQADEIDSYSDLMAKFHKLSSTTTAKHR